jgi:hypothetical protein
VYVTTKLPNQPGLRAPQTRENSSGLGGVMKKHLIALAMLVASFGLVFQAGSAKAFLLNDRSPNVTVAQIVAGGGMSAAYLLTTYHHGRFERFTSPHSLKMFGLTTVGCFALTPLIGAGLVGYNEHRELKSSEVFMMVGDCVVPIIGGLLMKAAFDANPQWDAGTGRPTR